MIGHRPDELVGKKIIEVMGENGFQTILPHIKAVLTGQRVEYETDVHFKDVGPRLLHSFTHLIKIGPVTFMDGSHQSSTLPRSGNPNSEKSYFFGKFSIAAIACSQSCRRLQIATVPPTVKLTADRFGRERAGMVFGWIFTGHQIGAASAALAAGIVRTDFLTYLPAFFAAGALCIVAALLILSVPRPAARRITAAMPLPARG